MTLLAIIALSAVMLTGISHLVALRGERHRFTPPMLDSAPVNIHRPVQRSWHS
ncbi:MULTISPECIES: hypothetical protein [unclassified Rhizobium]|uniref:hypothetical protein n=1 Tax=unclassified Rhizobium TaxID=2613769 RepID=UPI000ADB9D09|nr:MULTISPECIES: hypothetical protein [unclassified Rhizobium]TCM55829.1 hypothetical protein C8J36_103195 [Rhizobium sp. PP-F2F-G48]